jgi:hypothetical protein
MSDDEEESILSLSTLLFAVVTLAVYILFLRPTPTARNNSNNNGTAATPATTPTTATAAARTTAVQQRRANALAGANANATARRRQQQQQQQQQNNNNTTVATIQQRRPPVLSENAIEVLKNCKAYPPHVEPRSIKSNSNNSIGCYNLLSDSGLISFNYLKAASAASAAASAANSSNNNTKNNPIDLTKKTATTNTNANSNNNNNNNKIQRQERAKILSRLFANSSTVATPPMKGSTFIIGVSYELQLLQKKEQKLAIIRVIKGLATYYNVLVIVAVDNKDDNDDNSNSNSNHRYESTQKIHAQVVQTLRSSSSDEEGVGGGEKNDDSLLLLSESILPSHRILLSNTKSSAVGRIALVRQLSSNIGLTIDFNPEVKLQLEKFGYNVSIIKNWSDTFPSPPSV